MIYYLLIWVTRLMFPLAALIQHSRSNCSVRDVCPAYRLTLGKLDHFSKLIIVQIFKMVIGYELTLGNCFSHSSSLKNILTLKRSFSFVCSDMGIGLFSHKISLEGERGITQLPLPMAFLSFRVSTDQVAASCLAGFVTRRQSSFSTELFH